MVRFALGPRGVVVDAAARLPGRGAYLCPSVECFDRGRRRIAGVLRASTVDLDSLKREFAGRLSE